MLLKAAASYVTEPHLRLPKRQWEISMRLNDRYPNTRVPKYPSSFNLERYYPPGSKSRSHPLLSNHGNYYYIYLGTCIPPVLLALILLTLFKPTSTYLLPYLEKAKQGKVPFST